MTALPKQQASDLAKVRAALLSPAAGPDVVEAREALERLASALEGAQRLRATVLSLGVQVRAYLDIEGAPHIGASDRDAERLLAAMCDAEELAT